MNMMNKIYTFILGLTLLLTTACESNVLNTIPDPEDELSEITVIIPDADLPQASTRMTTIEERTVGTNEGDVYVFVFRASSNEYINHYPAVVKNPTATAKTFKFPKIITNDDFFLVVIANAKEWVEKMDNAGAYPGQTYEEIQAMLVMDYAGKWPDQTKDGVFKLLPMWGRTASAPADKKVHTATLVRNVAAINVPVNAGNGITGFEIQQITLCNVYNQIALIPNPKNVETGNLKVNNPSLPTLRADRENFFDLEYKGSDGSLTADEMKNGITSQIYIPEQKAGSKTTAEDHFHLIIEAKYNGTPTFYRIDIANSIKNVDGFIKDYEFLPVLRNHKYTLNITAVKDLGFDSFEKAHTTIGGPGTNLIVDLVCEDDMYHNIFYNGKYYVKSDRKAIYRNFEAVSKIPLKILANEAGKLEIAGGGAWLTIARKDGAPIANINRGLNEFEVSMQKNSGTNAASRGATMKIDVKGLKAEIPIAQGKNGQKDLIAFNPPVSKYWAVARGDTETGITSKGTAISLGECTNDTSNDPVKVARDGAGKAIDWAAEIVSDPGKNMKWLRTPYVVNANYDHVYQTSYASTQTNNKERLFFFDLANKWDQDIEAGKDEVEILIYAIDDPEWEQKLTIKVFGLLKVGNLYVSPTHPQQGKNKYFSSTPWTYDWDRAKAACDGLTGREWRLPSGDEIRSIILGMSGGTAGWTNQNDEMSLPENRVSDELINFWYTVTNWGYNAPIICWDAKRTFYSSGTNTHHRKWTNEENGLHDAYFVELRYRAWPGNNSSRNKTQSTNPSYFCVSEVTP